ncbi:MAG: hypothetical protein M1821_004031 [Bathelium mastoideum]|nr:MAG: hypothetical protein M1821_004031 [Bathelium mastoideum]KAI9691102.1 MAG: hypothetical protein M1822_008722 [Bathelium mastoideum]
MASNSYPDPTASQLPSGTGPFYNDSRSVESDIQIAAELSRNAVPFHNEDDEQHGFHPHQGSPHGLPFHGQEADEHELARQLRDHANVQYLGQQSPRDDSPDGVAGAKKRAKATRACDECRRKKIKCDAANETGEIPCSNCKRTTAQCLFTRNPQKRGPNKGYIKELSDRVASLEQERATGRLPATAPQFFPASNIQSQLDQSLVELQDYGSPIPMPSRKRSFSAAQGSREASSNKRPEHLHGLGDSEEVVLGDGNAEAALSEYYRRIHPNLPILPSRSRLFTMTSSCLPLVREAFFYSIAAATSADQSIAQHAARILATPENLQTEPLPALLVLLTSLVLLAMASDLLGPGGIFGNSISQPRWLYEAVGLALSLKLNHTVDLNSPIAADPDSDYGIGRRLFWVIYILDRFHAVGSDAPLYIQDTCAFLHVEDESVLGSGIFQLAGICTIISDIATTVQHRDSAAPERAKEPQNQLLERSDATMNRILLSKTNQILTSSSNELAATARYHTRLLIMNLDADTPPTTKLDLASDIISRLTHSNMPATAIHHHFKFLATLVLVELSKAKETSDVALGCLEEYQNALSMMEPDPGFWDLHIRSIVASKLNQIRARSQSGSSSNKQGLQHLADAAIKEGQGDQGSSDVAEAIRKAEAAATAMEGPEEQAPMSGGYLGALL